MLGLRTGFLRTIENEPRLLAKPMLNPPLRPGRIALKNCDFANDQVAGESDGRPSSEWAL